MDLNLISRPVGQRIVSFSNRYHQLAAVIGILILVLDTVAGTAPPVNVTDDGSSVSVSWTSLSLTTNAPFLHYECPGKPPSMTAFRSPT
jgi:hypothetical protein